MTTLNDVAQMTRVDVASKQLAKAIERVHRLEGEADATFAELLAALDEMDKIHVTVDVEMTPGLTAAFAEFKRTLIPDEASKVPVE